MLANNAELGVKLTSYIESRTNVGAGPLGGPMLLIIGRHYDYDKEAGAGLKHMLYLKHTVEGASVKSLQTFIDHVTYLDGLVSERERPTADTLFQWFFGQVRKLPLRP